MLYCFSTNHKSHPDGEPLFLNREVLKQLVMQGRIPRTYMSYLVHVRYSYSRLFQSDKICIIPANVTQHRKRMNERSFRPLDVVCTKQECDRSKHMMALWCRRQDALRAKKRDTKKKLEFMEQKVWAPEVQQLLCEREKEGQLQLELEAGLRKHGTLYSLCTLKMFGEVNPTNAPSGWKCTHHVKSGKDCEQCFVEILLAQILERFG